MTIKFDLTFLRNVPIYFDRPVVLDVCRSIAKQLEPGDYLILGLSESLNQDLARLKQRGIERQHLSIRVISRSPELPGVQEFLSELKRYGIEGRLRRVPKEKGMF